ncbi:hypothetical protein [Streptomyces niveus]|uniref:hypothetical protein n=1 Tax=Streptomyces niveus TaxID=193462 RepID=UPI003626B60A
MRRRTFSVAAYSSGEMPLCTRSFTALSRSLARSRPASPASVRTNVPDSSASQPRATRSPYTASKSLSWSSKGASWSVSRARPQAPGAPATWLSVHQCGWVSCSAASSARMRPTTWRIVAPLQ